MVSANYGTLPVQQMKTFADAVMDAAQVMPVFAKANKIMRGFYPYPENWRLGAIRRHRRPTIWLLEIDGKQMGPFNTLAARNRFISVTRELQNAQQ